MTVYMYVLSKFEVYIYFVPDLQFHFIQNNNNNNNNNNNVTVIAKIDKILI